MGGEADLDLLYCLARSLRATRMIETGVAYGWSSLALLLALAEEEAGLLVSTDRPYPAVGVEAYVGCAVPNELRGRWRLLPLADREALPEALDLLPVIDLAHYDSDKTRAGRAWALPKLWESLRPGGLLIVDDIDDDGTFAELAARLEIEPIVVRAPSERVIAGAAGVAKVEKYVGVLRRR
jgi:predicted O-methyltransferase YrrM